MAPLQIVENEDGQFWPQAAAQLISMPLFNTTGPVIGKIRRHCRTLPMLGLLACRKLQCFGVISHTHSHPSCAFSLACRM